MQLHRPEPVSAASAVPVDRSRSPDRAAARLRAGSKVQRLFAYADAVVVLLALTRVITGADDLTSSGTMALAVNMGYRKDRKKTFWLMVATALLGATFVSMQAFEWSKLISEGVRPWANPFGAAQFGSSFFMITGFHGMHVTAGVIYLLIVAFRVKNGYYEKRGGNYEIVEIAGLYWHFVDLVWVFIFAFFYLW